MAWSAPLTAVDGLELSAAQYNQYIRDNLLETAPAMATVASQYFVATANNKIAARICRQASVATSQTTTSTTFTDLATKGPSLTVDHGETVLVFWSCKMSNNTNNVATSVGVGASGSDHVSPHNSWRLLHDGVSANETSRYSAFREIGRLNPGTSTFTLKYKVASSSTGTFSDRNLIVMPL